MILPDKLEFTDNSAAASRPDYYLCVEVNVEAVLKSWKSSLYSFEWLRPDGAIKTPEELTELEREKRTAVEKLLHSGGTIEKPILGIGMLDNIEIGSGRAQFLTLAALGLKTMPVHIPLSNQKDFKKFIV
jgi:hypothetical protein